MEQKTIVKADEDRQEVIITREFDLPVNLLFRAYTEARLVEQWMGNQVLKMENKRYGSYLFEKNDGQGKVLFRANGVVHDFIPDKKIIRTFEMENTPFPVQLEFLEFMEVNADRSKLTIHIIYKSVEDRNKMLQLPFAKGINMAHDKLEKMMITKHS